MSTNKRINVICIVAVLLSVLIMVLLMNGSQLGLQAEPTQMGYETRLFSQDQVHTIDLVVEDWEGFLQTCTNEEYVNCTAVIDGERFSNVGLRAKGNTSLSSVASMDSSRYSFKLEFDQYDSTKSYYGLDKLSLNNLIQDNTMMKDYLTYRLMAQMDAAAPLCSYVQINVNGEPWGLYLAVEAIEESFLQRNYGKDYGELYKPDSMSNGAGPGNGKDFKMDQWEQEQAEDSQKNRPGLSGETLRQALEEQNIDTNLLTGVDWETATMENLAGQLSQLPGMDLQALSRAIMGRNGAGGARGSADVKLQYIDDDPESYTNIFGNAKTPITQEDQTRLIEALKRLSAGENLENTVDIESVIRYFVVHTFVCNEDSYTGSMIHNYYLYEQDGVLSMLPWDYNLAFGGFQSGNAAQVINGSIYTPASGGELSDRPMLAWIFADEEYTSRYEQLYTQLLEVDMQALVSQTAELIAPYLREDPTKFCTEEEFVTAVAAMQKFLQLRCQSVSMQLSGETAAVDTADLNLSDMGNMGGGMNRPQNGNMPQQIPDGTDSPTGQMPEMNQPGMPQEMGPPPGQMPADGQMRPQGGMGQRPQRPSQFFGDAQSDANGPIQNSKPNTAEQSDQNRPKTTTGFLPVLICIIVLAGAIVFAAFFHRRKN